jgi:RNA polymerase sigma factor (sigma-70 family)
MMVALSGLLEGEVQITDMAENILHDTVETALRLSERFDPSRSAYSWLMGIAVNKLKEMRRSTGYEKKRVQVFEDTDPKEGDSIDQGGKEDIEAITAEERIDAVLYHSARRSTLEDHTPRLKEMLDLVKESERQILMLAIIDGLSGTDLAAALGIREGAAYVRLARAKKHLREKYLSIQARKDY